MLLPPAVLALDIGASSVKSAIVEHRGEWRLVVRFDAAPVPARTFDALADVVVAVVERATAASPGLRRLGISTTGAATADDVVLSSGFYAGYRQIAWREILDGRCSRRFDVVRVVNDGRAAAWGTFLADARAAGTDVAHFVVGTGIGGGLVSGGRLFHGAHHLAGSFGHIKVTPDPTGLCVCGGRGCVELFAAGPAVLRHAAARMPPGDAALVSVRALAEAAHAGSLEAREAFQEAGRWLGMALGAVANAIDPEFVTIGGGVVAAAEVLRQTPAMNWYVDAAAAAARIMVTPRIADHLKVITASLFNDAALIGAAALAMLERPAGAAGERQDMTHD